MLLESNWSYEEACEIINKLRARNLEAYISIGSIYVSSRSHGDEQIVNICKELGLPEPFSGSASSLANITLQ